MIDKFLAFAKENKLIENKDKILVGVSGGVDSSVLLFILNNLKSRFGLTIAIAHVNYGIRKESDIDQKFVENLAKKYDIPIYIHRTKLTGSNIEERARDIRYGFFDNLIQSKKYKKIAIAHQKNDLAETLILNIARGSGIRGLSPMPTVSDNMIRPMLYATRKEIEQFANDNGVEFVTDKTNDDIKYTRNMLRHNIMPSLLDLSPNFLQIAAREAQTFQELNTYVKEKAKKILQKSTTKKEGGIVLDLVMFSKLDNFMKGEVLVSMIEALVGNTKNISSANISSILSLTKTNKGTKTLSLPRGLFAERIYDKMFIGPKKEKGQPKAKKFLVLTDGQNNFEDFSFTVSRRETVRPKNNKDLVHIDISKSGPLLVRYKEDGDRITIAENKTKKLQDIFVDEKIPRKMRENIPLVVNQKNEIVWIPLIRVNDKFLADNGSKQIISIKYKETRK